MHVAKISAKGQIVIPKAVRDQLGITPGKKVLFRIVGKHAEITPIDDDPVKALRGIIKGKSSLTDELLDVRKRDNELDEKYPI